MAPWSDKPAGGRVWRCLVPVLGMLLLAGNRVARSDGALRAAPEYRIKAAYIFNFLSFVTWPAVQPPMTARPVVIGILGDDPFDDAFGEVEGRAVGADRQPLKIARLGAYRETTELGACRLVFIASSERRRLRAILGRAAAAGVLTVSDAEGFVDAGGMIGLVMRGKFVRWEINRRALAEAGLSVSSQLLRNAVRVVGTDDRASNGPERRADVPAAAGEGGP